jgi:hypothetical protein
MRKSEQDPKIADDLKSHTIAGLAEILNLAESTLYALLRGHRSPNFVADRGRTHRCGAAKSQALPEIRATRVPSRKR